MLKITRREDRAGKSRENFWLLQAHWLESCLGRVLKTSFFVSRFCTCIALVIGVFMSHSPTIDDDDDDDMPHAISQIITTFSSNIMSLERIYVSYITSPNEIVKGVAREREKINYRQKSILQQNTNFNYLRFSSSLSLSHSIRTKLQKCKWEFTNFLFICTHTHTHFSLQLNKLWSLISALAHSFSKLPFIHSVDALSGCLWGASHFSHLKLSKLRW